MLLLSFLLSFPVVFRWIVQGLGDSGVTVLISLVKTLGNPSHIQVGGIGVTDASSVVIPPRCVWTVGRLCYLAVLCAECSVFTTYLFSLCKWVLKFQTLSQLNPMELNSCKKLVFPCTQSKCFCKVNLVLVKCGVCLKALKWEISILKANQQGTADAKSLTEQLRPAQDWELQIAWADYSMGCSSVCGSTERIHVRFFTSYLGQLGTLNFSEE